MSVRVSVSHSGIRSLCLPEAGDESVRLQLCMDPGKTEEFRLMLRDTSGTTDRSVIRQHDVFIITKQAGRHGCTEGFAITLLHYPWAHLAHFAPQYLYLHIHLLHIYHSSV